MQKKILILIITSLLVAGCNNKSNQKSTDKQSEAVEQTDSTSSQSSNNSTDDVRALAYKKAEKGNLWLSIYKQDYSDVGNKLGQGMLYGHSDLLRLDHRAEEILKLCSDKNGTCSLKAIQKDPKKYFNSLSIRLFHNISEKTLNEYNTLIQKLIEREPRLPEIDAAGKVYADHFIKLAMALNELKKYVDNNEYKLDDCKKGPELFRNIAHEYSEFTQATMAFRATYNKLYNEYHNIQKLDIKKQGLTFKYNCIDIMDSINEIVTLINEKYEEKNQFKNLDIAAVEQKIQQIETITNQLMTIKGKNKEINAQALNSYSYDRFVDGLPKMTNQMKIVLKKLHDKDIDKEINMLNIYDESLTRQYNSVINK